jgi:aquaporin Z
VAVNDRTHTAYVTNNANGDALAIGHLDGHFAFIVRRVTSATANAATAAIAIGLTLTVFHLVGIPITGTSVNPAHRRGPGFVVGGTALSEMRLFIAAPVPGGVLAAGLHRLLYREEDIRLAAEAQQPGQAGAS